MHLREVVAGLFKSVGPGFIVLLLAGSSGSFFHVAPPVSLGHSLVGRQHNDDPRIDQNQTTTFHDSAASSRAGELRSGDQCRGSQLSRMVAVLDPRCDRNRNFATGIHTDRARFIPMVATGLLFQPGNNGRLPDLDNLLQSNLTSHAALWVSISA